jgi:hypothetical protein
LGRQKRVSEELASSNAKERNKKGNGRNGMVRKK